MHFLEQLIFLDFHIKIKSKTLPEAFGHIKGKWPDPLLDLTHNLM